MLQYNSAVFIITPPVYESACYADVFLHIY